MNDAEMTPRRARTRARLLRAARYVIAKRGVRGATVDRICKQAGYTRGAFYSNYSSMPELMGDVIAETTENRIAGLRAGVDAVADLPTDPDQALRSAVEIVVRMQPRSAEEVLLMTELGLYAIRHPETQASQPAAAERTRQLLDELITSLLNRLGRRLRISPGTSVNLLHAYVDHISLARLAAGAGDPTDSWVEGLTELLLVITEPTPAS